MSLPFEAFRFSLLSEDEQYNRVQTIIDLAGRDIHKLNILAIMLRMYLKVPESFSGRCRPLLEGVVLLFSELTPEKITSSGRYVVAEGSTESKLEVKFVPGRSEYFCSHVDWDCIKELDSVGSGSGGSIRELIRMMNYQSFYGFIGEHVADRSKPITTENELLFLLTSSSPQNEFIRLASLVQIA